mgnify:FL=1
MRGHLLSTPFSLARALSVQDEIQKFVVTLIKSKRETMILESGMLHSYHLLFSKSKPAAAVAGRLVERCPVLKGAAVSKVETQMKRWVGARCMPGA